MINHIITSTLLLLFLLLLSVCLEKRIDPRLKYALWLLAVVKLLIPLPAFETPMSILNLVNPATLERDSTDQRPDARSDTAAADPSLKQEAPDQQASSQKTLNQNTLDQQTGYEKTAAQKASFQRIPAILTALWLFGCLLCCGIFLWSAVRLRRWLRHGRVLMGNYKDRLSIYETDGLGTPCLIGVFAPAIYLDRANPFDREQLSLILAHEYTHFRHGDHIWAAVRCICVSVYWYNPIVWLAARRSAGDGELACDAGTLEHIGAQNPAPYARTLILAAQNLSQPAAARMTGFRTGAAGGMKEMKRRINLLKHKPRTRLVTLAATLALCGIIVGCTYGSAVGSDPDGIVTAPELTETAQKDMSITRTETETLPTAEINTELSTEHAGTESGTESSSPESMIYHGTALYTVPEPDYVCICIQPSVLREHQDYFYIPSGSAQSQLISLMERMKPDWQDDDDRSVVAKKGLKETGYQLYYKGCAYMVFEGGYLYATEVDEERGVVESLVRNEALCGLVQQLLSEDLGYEPVDITQIRDIVSAKLDVCSIFTDQKFYSQTITDRKTLALFEDWFSNASYISFGAGCGNENACLELTLSDGNVIRLSMAIDSCSNFGVNGVYYDYRPKTSWDNAEFYQCFDEIPFEY